MQCIVKDSANFLDHINGKKHQKALGMSMRIERVGLEAVKNRFESNKRKIKQQAERNEDDYETRLIRLQVRFAAPADACRSRLAAGGGGSAIDGSRFYGQLGAR
jgi:hypothetical protein